MMPETIIRKVFSGMRRNIHFPERVPTITPTVRDGRQWPLGNDLAELQRGIDGHPKQINQQRDRSGRRHECIASQIESQQSG